VGKNPDTFSRKKENKIQLTMFCTSEINLRKKEKKHEPRYTGDTTAALVSWTCTLYITSSRNTVFHRLVFEA